MPHNSPVHNLVKQLDKVLLMGFLARISQNIRYRKYRSNGSWVAPSAVVDKESILNGNNKIYSDVKLNKVSAGRFTYVGPESKIALTTIGSFCSIGRRVSIGLGFHPSNWLSTHPSFYSMGGQTTKTFSKSNQFIENKPISIGHDVWIGADAIVLDGITIGTGSIVAAGAVVTSDVRPYSIVAGVPAREIKRRFDDTKIAELIEWAWWTLPEEELSLLAQQFNTAGNWTVAELKSAIMRTSDTNLIYAIKASNEK